jgi:hypothetical protein
VNRFIIALIRTVVPSAVGALFGWLASLGLSLDAETQAGLVLALIATFTGMYYAAVTYAATKWPAFGWLLGVAATPTYTRVGKHEVDTVPAHLRQSVGSRPRE